MSSASKRTGRAQTPPSIKTKKEKHETSDNKESREDGQETENKKESVKCLSFSNCFSLELQADDVQGIDYSPNAVAVSNDGETVYVNDIVNNRIHVYTSQGKLLNRWGDHVFNDNSNFDIGLSRSGELYVTDVWNGDQNRIQVFDAKTGHLLRSFSDMTGPAVPLTDDKLNNKISARYFALSPDNRYLYFIRLCETRVLCADLSKSSTELYIGKVYGEKKEDYKLSELHHPAGLCISNDGAYIYVCDPKHRCVYQIDASTGKILPVIGNKNKKVPIALRETEVFYSPTYVCLSASGRYIYVSDNAQARSDVLAFSTKDFSLKGHVAGLATVGIDSGALLLNRPNGMSFCASSNRLYICDSSNSRVVVVNALD